MSAKIILCFHNHQPVGNFEFVLDLAYEKSYKPLLDVLSEFPSVKATLHHSGFLLEYLISKHPEYIEKMTSMVARGQVKIMQGAYYEPILSNIPRRDAVEQINSFREKLQSIFGSVSQSFWLAERVWEPHFPSILAAASVKIVPLDEYHFQYAGLTDENLSGHYITENEEDPLYVFPISKKLRYYMPYHTVKEVMDFILSNDGKVITMADDGEKFGLWPGTHELVHEKGWLRDLFTAISGESRIQTIFFEDALKEPSNGRIFIPACSYPEMMEWALSPEAQSEVASLKGKLSEREGLLVKGGFWKNFSVKYPEINIQTKRMLEVSSNVFARGIEDKTSLFMGQCNCAYWHGIFGGVYLPHLRHAIFEHLIKQEKKYNAKVSGHIRHLFSDREDVLIKNDFLAVYLNFNNGQIYELDNYAVSRNMQSVMSRKREFYHDKVDMNDNSGVKTIHSGFYLKDGAVELIYDGFERDSFIDFAADKEPTPEGLHRLEGVTCLSKEKYSYKKSQYDHSFILKDRLCKTVRVDGDTLRISGEFKEKIIQQWNIALSSEKEEIRSAGGNIPASGIFTFDTDIFEIVDVPFGIKALFTFNKKEKVMFYPVKTVSNSDSGVEEVFQGVSVNIIAGEKLDYSVRLCRV